MQRPRRARRLAVPLVAGLLAAGALTMPAAHADQTDDDPHTKASTVEVTGSQGDWQLSVDGEPFTVKGLTWGPDAADAAEYMPDIASMGVNTVRTWGTDETTEPLLDAAAENDVKVMLGFWLQPGGGPGSGGCVDYLTDDEYKQEMLAEFPKWVDTYKDHDGVLMWNVGNESVLGLQNCYDGDELEKQRDAYTTFVNDITKEIHKVDPNHPVTSTDAWTGAWPYYQKNAPDLDLYSVNAYADVCGIQDTWEEGGYDKPYLVTESGPPGEWEVEDDANGVPDEPSDVDKAQGYKDAWECITGHEGVALGATLFHYGLEDDFGGVWFNLLPDGEKRLSYYAVKELYGGDTSGDNTPPELGELTVSGGEDGVPAGGDLTLQTEATDPDGDDIEYEVAYSSNYIDENGALVTADETTDNGDGTLTATAPGKIGTWKVYVKARDGQGNIGIETSSVKVVPPPVDGTNLADGAETDASSYQTDDTGGCPCPPENAVDGDYDTRWAGDWEDPQWLQVDLGSSQSFHHVQLAWEPAFGSAYTIQTSEDGEDWETVYEETDGDGDIDDLDVDGTGRYVRLHMTERGTEYGYSLYEFGIYG